MLLPLPLRGPASTPRSRACGDPIFPALSRYLVNAQIDSKIRETGMTTQKQKWPVLQIGMSAIARIQMKAHETALKL